MYILQIYFFFPITYILMTYLYLIILHDDDDDDDVPTINAKGGFKIYNMTLIYCGDNYICYIFYLSSISK